MPNPSDFVRRISLNGSAGAYVEIAVSQACRWISVRQLASEAQVIIEVRHRTIADPDAETEQIPAGTVWEKGRSSADARAPSNQFQAGDTIGFFRSGTAATPIVVVREHTV